MKNPYEPETQEKGIINFGTSVNSIIPKTTIKYLPEFMTEKDCAYPDPLGKDPEFNSEVCRNTPFQ